MMKPELIRISQGKEDSVLRINEAGQARDYKHSSADTRDVVGMPRRRRETESRFWPQERVKKLTFYTVCFV